MQTVKATPNNSKKKTFTIRVKTETGGTIKLSTLPMQKSEFEAAKKPLRRRLDKGNKQS